MKVLIVYHTVYGHIQAMAKAVQEGAQGVAGIEVVLRRVQEFPDIVQHMEAEKGYSYQVYQSQASVPECTVDDLRQADGVVFGSPTRYGNMTAQMKKLIDSMAQLWLTGQMEGKPAGVHLYGIHAWRAGDDSFDDDGPTAASWHGDCRCSVLRGALIVKTLRETDWVVGGPNGAAAKLGLKRTTLITKMRRLGISTGPTRPVRAASQCDWDRSAEYLAVPVSV
jgi:flavodoxin